MRHSSIPFFTLFFAVFLAFFLSESVYAQITIEHFNTQTTGTNGLPSNVVKDVIVAEDGTIWGTAEDGPLGNYEFIYNTLFSYKSGEWKTYEELGDVRAILEDSQGRIWAVGGRVWSYEDGDWSQAYLENGDEVVGIESICEDNFGNIWLGEWNYFYKYDNEKWIRLPTSGKQGGTPIYSIIRHKRGDVFMGKKFEILKWDGETRERTLGVNYVLSLAEDTSGNIYSGSAKGIHVYNGVDWSVFEYGGFEEGSYPSVGEIKIDDENNMWIVSSQGLYQIIGGEESIIEEPNESYTIYRLALKDNILYLATSKGLRQYDMENDIWTAYKADGLVNGEIQSLLQVDTKMYVGTTDGCSIYNDGEWETFLDSGRFDKMLLDEEGNMWMLDENSFYKYDGENVHLFQSEEGLFPDGSNEVRDFLIDHEGSIWITGGVFVSKYIDEQWVVMEDGLPESSNTYSIGKVLFEDSKFRIWVGGYNFVQYFDGEEVVSFDESVLGEYFGRRASITEDEEGNIWMAVGREISTFDGQTWTNYNRYDDGLISNTGVRDLTVDKNGNIWVATRYGISKFDGQSFTNYTIEDGLIGYDFTTINVDYLNRIWVGTKARGINVIIDETTNIEAINEVFISVYPNPTNSTVSLRSKASNPIKKVILIDLQGKELAIYEDIGKSNFQLQVSDYSLGLYFLKIETLKGSIVEQLILN